MSLGSTLARLTRGLAADLEAFALPQRCPGCGVGARPEQLLCADCLAQEQSVSLVGRHALKKNKRSDLLPCR